jgi:hypothetical protein
VASVVVQATATTTDAAAGTETIVYTYRVTDNCGNTTDVTETYVRGNLTPDISTTATPQVCAGDSYDLTTAALTDASLLMGTVTYHSATPATAANALASSTVAPAATTTYYIMKTAANGCIDEVPVIVTVKPRPMNDNCVNALLLSSPSGSPNAGQVAQDMTCATPDAANNPNFTGASCGAPSAANNPTYYLFTTDGNGGNLGIQISNATFPAGSSLRAGIFQLNPLTGCSAPLVQFGDCANFTSNSTQTISGLPQGTPFVLILDAMPAGAPIVFDIKLDNVGALNVSWLDFVGRNVNNVNILNWATSTERNSNYFEVERSADGSFFEKIGTLKGNGTTNMRSDYIYKDAAPYTGANFYRLRQVDFDGTASYSKTIVVNVKSDKAAILNLRPNPTNDQLYYNIYSPEAGNAVVSISDVLGRVISTQSIGLTNGTTPMEYNAENLAAGSYMIVVKTNNGTVHKQFIKTDR